MELDYGEPTTSFGTGEIELNPRLAPGEIFDVAMQGDEEGDVAERAQARRESEALRRGAKFYKLPQDGVDKPKSEREQGEELEEIEETATPPPEVPSPIGGGLDVRLVALNLNGEPIKQLSTSRLFAYVTHCGAAPLGLEWINDSSCNVVFADAESTLAGLAAISRTTGNNVSLLALPEAHDLAAAAAVQLAHERGEPTEEPIPEILTAQLLQSRRARAVPLKLYTMVEREAMTAAQHIPAAVAAVPDDAPAIYAEMAAEQALQAANAPSVVALRQLQGALWVRFALESADNKNARAKGFSQWYAAHGLEAGREVVPKLLNIQPKQARGRGNQGQTQVDLLDAELDEMRNQATDDEADTSRPEGEAHAERAGKWEHDYFGHEGKSDGPREFRRPRNSRGGRGTYRGSATMGALDEELETHASERQRDRSSSPGRRGVGSASAILTPSSNVRIRGRGSMRAPGASRGWEDADSNEATSSPFRPVSGKGAGMMADAAERTHRQPRRRRDQGEERWQRNGEGGAANSNARLADRFSGSSLLDRLA